MTDQYYLDMCVKIAEQSRDPSTKVGAVIVHKYNYCTGYNRFAQGLANTPVRWNDRDLKIKLVVHAEIVALISAMHARFPLNESILYMCAKTGTTIWGGPPCTRCTVELIQAGITEIRVPVAKDIPDRWLDDLNLSRSILVEAGVKYTELK